MEGRSQKTARKRFGAKEDCVTKKNLGKCT